MKKSYIWSLPTRIFHWLLVFYILVLYISSEVEELLNLHASFGYGVFILAIFRLFWGFFGPMYAKFSDFNFSLKKALNFGLNIFNHKSYAGHNPLASIVMFAIIIFLILTTVSGILTYGIQEGRGVLSFLNNSLFSKMELFSEIHEFFSSVLILLIFIHISGVILDYVTNKNSGVLNSIFSGYKNVEAKSVNLTLFQKIISFIFLFFAVFIVIYSLFFNTALTKLKYKKISYSKIMPEFIQECASCHTLYPPHLLPKKSWQKLMDNLQNHFGDDASLQEPLKKKIEKFLVKNAAESSNKEASFYILKSIKNKDIIAISKTSYWKKRHKNIDKEIFKSDKVVSKANCKACHKGFEEGLIEDSLIKIPKG